MNVVLRVKDEKISDNSTYDVVQHVLKFGEQIVLNLNSHILNMTNPSSDKILLNDAISLENHLMNQVWASLELSYDEFLSEIRTNSNKRKNSISHRSKLRYNFMPTHPDIRQLKSSTESESLSQNSSKVCFSKSGYKLQLLCRSDLEL